MLRLMRGRSLTAAVVVLLGTGVAAQDSAITLHQAIAQALARYPGVAAAAAEREAVTATIDLARQAYRPRIDGLLQLNRATHSNVAGLLLPQGVISPISGPVATDNSDGSVWGTAVGALVVWKPFDFGARHAGVLSAEKGEEVARWSLERVRLETAAATADAFLTVLASEATVRAAQAAVDRADVLLRSVQALVDAGLRPGVDAASAKAEQAAAVMQRIQAIRSADTARALLAHYVGGPARAAALPSPSHSERPVESPAGAGPPDEVNPVIREQQAAIDEAATRFEVARRSADPDVALQGTVYGRGTGVLADNSSGTGADGLGIDAGNWAVGVTVTVPMMEWANRHAREAVETARLKAATARRELAASELARRRSTAMQERQAAWDLMGQAPLVVSAARDAHAQATARYQSGLSSITDVADAQRRLAQAEIDAALVELAMWRAQLDWNAIVSGSAEAFLALVGVQP
jgi:outer membrane protein TolC